MAASIACFSVVAYVCAQQVYRSEVANKARNTANYVENVGSWASQYGRLFVNDKGKSTHLESGQYHKLTAESLGAQLSEADITAATGFFGKNPALIQRELADVVAASDNPVKFRLTAENYMNPSNAPNTFELMAIQRIKSQKLTEMGEFINDEFRYAKPIYMKESCLKCHGSPDAAPPSVTALYGRERGYGFSAGDLSGVISVTAPAKFEAKSYLTQTFDAANAFLVLGMLFLAAAIPVTFVFFGILRPISRISANAEKLSKGVDVKDELEVGPGGPRDEIETLKAAIRRVNTSLMLSIGRSKDKTK